LGKFNPQNVAVLSGGCKYIVRELTPLSKPLKTKEQAEKARLKYPERECMTIWERSDPNQRLVPEVFCFFRLVGTDCKTSLRRSI
jgi:hypothetical protein